MNTISVIIPVYNASKHIHRTVKIINKSTKIPNEILLINDGSTDNSLQLCQKLEQEYQNVKVFNKPNGGVADARNYGLAHAAGDYVCFVDQDDYVDSNMYENVLLEAEKKHSDVVMVSTGQIVNNERIPFEQLKNGFFSDDEVKQKLLLSFLFRGYEQIKRDDECSITSSIWKCVIKRSLFEDNDIRFRRFISYEDDYIMMAALLCYAKKVSMMEYIGYYWLINRESESHKAKYISDYGAKTFQLHEYMIAMLESAGIDKKIVDIYSDQLLFEKTIDVISNAYSSINSTNRKQRTLEVVDYIKKANLFEMNLDNIKPLSNYHRLKVLFVSVQKKNISQLIRRVSQFVWLENKIHGNQVIMKIINSRK